MRNSGLICCALLFVLLTACAAPAQTPEDNVERELADASGVALTEPKETDPSVQPEEMDESVESGEATSAGTEELSALLDTLISGATQKGGVWAAAIQRAGEETCISTDSGPMQSASLIKLFVAAAVEEHWAAVTAIESYSGETARLLFDMLSVSDNDATNHLVSRLGGGDAAAGMALVNQYCAAHGYADTSMGRLMLIAMRMRIIIPRCAIAVLFCNPCLRGKCRGAQRLWMRSNSRRGQKRSRRACRQVWKQRIKPANWIPWKMMRQSSGPGSRPIFCA